jgi:2-polyprenyl-6-methoxyphenol hydroxylase-like FAD-dependent oxidoreductase
MGDGKYLATAYMATGGGIIMTRRHNAEYIQAYLSYRGGSSADRRITDAHSQGVQAVKGAFAHIFTGAGWKADEVLESITPQDNFYCERMGLVQLERWHPGRVALVDDAAYCPTATTGTGTASAVVGAYVLAGGIARSWDGDTREGTTTGRHLEAARRGYEDRFPPFMDQVQSGLLEGKGGMDMMPTSALGITLLNFLMGAASLLKVDLLK